MNATEWQPLGAAGVVAHGITFLLGKNRRVTDEEKNCQPVSERIPKRNIERTAPTPLSVQLTEEHTLCCICYTEFATDILTTEEERWHLPVVGSSCDHYFCHGCLLNEQSRLAEIHGLEEWIPCMHCKVPDSFCPQSPKYHTLLLSILPLREEVDHDCALDYVAAVKSRFDPEVYRHFFKLLRRYKRGRCSVNDLLKEVSIMFVDHPDLLREFSNFMPPALQDYAKSQLEVAAKRSEERVDSFLIGSREDYEECVMTYVDSIKEASPELYPRFLRILCRYQSGRADVKRLLDEVSALFSNRPEFLGDFLSFLPPECRSYVNPRTGKSSKHVERSTHEDIEPSIELDCRHTTCCRCRAPFSTDVRSTDGNVRRRLPILSSSSSPACDHYFCHGCILEQQTRIEEVTGEKAFFVHCMMCGEEDAFCPVEPTYHRLLIDLVGSARSGAA